MSFLMKYRNVLKLIARINRPQIIVQSCFYSSLTKLHLPTLTSQNLISSITNTRFKSKGRKQKKEESEDEESESETEDFDSLVVDKQTKVLTLRVSSLRTDVVLKSSLYVSRSKVDEAFYESKIRVNGKKLLKKSDLAQEGDELDIIKSVDITNPNFLNVARVEVLQIVPKGESFSIRVRRCKSLLVENYEDKWTPAS
ncbi:hypothetical protein RI129_006656 [Pyrocoelia pectoralis]|uniref:Mitochondrial transcription rescue factor 1 C-terminal domain-containing protein n=1 Tax=Pyrocoelia pectoralis TaxID=417401 RepID=A0AAN7VGS6_9COLE